MMTCDKKGKILMLILYFRGVFQLIEKLKLCPLAAAADGCSNYLNIVVFK